MMSSEGLAIHHGPLEQVVPVGAPIHAEQRPTDVEIDPYRGDFRVAADATIRLAYSNIVAENTTLRHEKAILEQSNEEKEQRSMELIARLLNIRYDVLVERALTPAGLKDYLENNPEIKEELKEGNWAVLRLDGRFVNYINDYGHDVGDAFLRQGGDEILTVSLGLGRQVHDRRAEGGEVEVDQRTQPRGRRASDRVPRPEFTDEEEQLSIEGDIPIREGGDEFAVILRGVTHEQALEIADRYRLPLTPEQAVINYRDGKIPFVASVGVAHSSEAEPQVISLLNQGRFYDAVALVTKIADQREIASKNRQYATMWEMVLEQYPAGEPALLAQPSNREVARLFLKARCSRFFRDPQPYLDIDDD